MTRNFIIIRVLLFFFLLSPFLNGFGQNESNLSIKVHPKFNKGDINIFLTLDDCICANPKCSNCPDFLVADKLNWKRYKTFASPGTYNVILIDSSNRLIVYLEKVEIESEKSYKIKISPKNSEQIPIIKPISNDN